MVHGKLITTLFSSSTSATITYRIKNDSGLGGNIRDGHPPILGYYRVSDNTNYRLIMQPTTEWGQQGTHWLYDANGAIVEMSAYGQWCI